MTQKESITKNIREIEWDDTYSINVSIIDEEHKKFIKTVNKVVNIANQHENDREEVAIVLNELTMYALNHFKTEEEYMRKSKYAGYQLHKKEHNSFISKTVDFCNRTVDGDYDIRDDLLEYLQTWLVNHIRGTDKKLINCFHRNILSEREKEFSIS